MRLARRRALKEMLPFILALSLGACGGGGGNSLPAVGGGASAPPASIEGDLSIKTLSNRADMISGGDAYVEITLPKGASSTDVKVDVDGVDVTSAFAERPNGRFLGVVTGLKAGTNILTAKLRSASKGSRLQITNYDRGGPIFTGPQIQPWICATKSGTPTTVTAPGTTLSATVTTRVSGLDSDPVDAKCNAPTKFTYYYKPIAKEGSGCTFSIAGANPCFVAYEPAARPADGQIADFMNDRGDKVKAMLRLELGTADRGMYQVLAYFDPAQSWTPWAPQKGWNGKLLWKFGASVTGNRFQQNPSNVPAGGNVFDANALSAGFIVVAAQLTDHWDNNNEYLAAEQMMMVKEHIVETYGEIRYTMSDGGSGGSMMQTVIASAMPGLLQGIQIGTSFPDAVSTWMETRECGMLGKYYTTPAGSGLTAIQKTAIEGKPGTYCPTWSGINNAQIPSVANVCGVGFGFPASIVYDAVLRPNGVRCSIHDVLVNILGTAVDSDRNVKPRLPYDNAGVQYGLAALKSGAITAEQFVQLNEGIGAYDTDMNWTGGDPLTPVTPAPRFRSLPDVFPQIYQSGLLDNAANLAKVAIIDLRPDLGPNIHQPWRSLQARARLDAANGGHANSVIRGSGGATGAAMTAQSFQMMDRWLSAIEADRSTVAIDQRVINNKPGDVRDGCYNSTGATAADIATELSLTDPACPIAATLLQTSPRQVAGGPLAEDVFKCQLKGLDTASPDYGGVVFTALQRTRLAAVFPDGVCDWTRPGVGQTSQQVLLDFASGPSGTAIPKAPTSMRVDGATTGTVSQGSMQ
ncbi:DUF6351 family protein [Variovorax paradoxus]|uniref:DUF6351 domain-containing protein n=1 Tax=Variovorax paradoxus TaxID=34073 RepID=A0A0H2LWB9_VARPD|nr:DUF6351 family protein [Variovorax paradoxus]KLN52827.1 hypothetical protein VPARA_60940 [Variovorax paradoxus]